MDASEMGAVAPRGLSEDFAKRAEKRQVLSRKEVGQSGAGLASVRGLTRTHKAK
jgi:hypothetical protein